MDLEFLSGVEPSSRSFRRFMLAALTLFALCLAPFACSSGTPLPKLSPATQEAAARLALIEAAKRCGAWAMENPKKTDENAVLWETCYVLQNSDEAIVLLERALAPRSEDPPDGGPGQGVRNVGDGGP